MAFAVKYQLTFDELTGGIGGVAYTPIAWKVDILEDAYGGGILDLTGTGNPLDIEWEDIDLFEDVVQPSRATLRVIGSTTNEFSEFFTATSETAYRMDVYRDVGAGYVLFWQGFVRPDDYEEDYTKATNFDVVIRATDGLERLESITYPTDNSLRSLLYHLQTAVAQTSFDWNMFENVNIYDSNMASTSSDSPLDQADIQSRYLRVTTNEQWDIAKVLWEILAPFGATIKQKGGAWYIERINLNDGNTYALRKFNSSQVFQSVDASVDPVLEIVGTGGTRVIIQSTIITERPMKKVEVTYEGDTAHNLVIDGEFQDNAFKATADLIRWKDVGSITYEEVALTTGDNALKVTSQTTDVATGDYVESEGQYIKKDVDIIFRFKYKIHFTSGTGTLPQYGWTLWIDPFDITDSPQYLLAAGTWTSSVTVNVASVPENDFDFFNDSNINITESTPIDGYLKVRLYEADGNSYTIEGISWANVRAQISTGEKNTEKVKQSYDVTDSTSLEKELTLRIADRGGWTYADYTGDPIYSLLQIQVDESALTTGDSVKMNILTVAETYGWVASYGGLGSNSFNTIDQLIDEIIFDGGDSYNVHKELVTGDTYNVFIEANQYDLESGLSMDFGTVVIVGSSITNIAQNNNTDPGALTGGYGQMEVGGEITGRWTDGVETGNLTDLLSQSILNKFGKFTQRHNGILTDWTKTVDMSSVIHDAVNNNGKYFMVRGGTFKAKKGVFDARWVEVTDTPKTVAKTTIEQSSTQSGTTNASASSGGGIWEPAFSKNTAFNKNFGTGGTDVSCGSHLHTGVYEPAFSKNTAFNKSFGTGAGDVACGSHTHAIYALCASNNIFTGQNFFKRDGDGIVMQGAGLGNSNCTTINFKDCALTSHGVLGFESIGNQILYLRNKLAADLRLGTSNLDRLCIDSSGHTYLSGRMYPGGSSNPYLSSTGAFLHMVNSNGDICIGPINASCAGFLTNRATFYMSKEVLFGVNCMGSASADLLLQRAGSTKATLLSTGMCVEGVFTSTGENAAFSDRRLKSNIRDISNPLQKVLRMCGQTYRKDDRRSMGFMAQDLKQIIPEVVHDGKYLAVNSAGITALNTEAIKVLACKIKELENGVTSD